MEKLNTTVFLKVVETGSFKRTADILGYTQAGISYIIGAMEQELNKSGSIGKQLDFFAQEMNREANTTLSKSSDLKVSDAAIRLKTTIEKIREQVQNIE